MKGKVKNVNLERSFGFIRCEDGNEYYFKEDSLISDLNFQEIARDTDVEFDIQRQRDGRLKAVNCRIVENESIKFFKEHVLDLSDKKDQYDIFCDHAKKYAERLKTGEVTTSMIRKIYARILNARTVTDIKLLRPHFAYTSGRNEKNHNLREFMDLLDYLVRKMDIDSEQHLNNFKQFMEAIVAYRKYVGNDK
jgi:CRISPR type III-A-associated protein Csm2